MLEISLLYIDSALDKIYLKIHVLKIPKFMSLYLLGNYYLRVDIRRQLLGVVVIDGDHPSHGAALVDISPAVAAPPPAPSPPLGLPEQFSGHPLIVNLHFYMNK